MKARKIPVVIECHPAWDVKLSTVPGWLSIAIGRGEIRLDEDLVHVKSKEGWVAARRDESYIMQGVKGEIYLCNKEIFEATYEVV